VQINICQNTHKKSDSERCKILNIGCRISYAWDTKSDVDFEVSVYQCCKSGFIVSRNIVSWEWSVYECNIHLTITFNNSTPGNVYMFSCMPAQQELYPPTFKAMHWELLLLFFPRCLPLEKLRFSKGWSVGVFTVCCRQLEGN
jgi:hypothetical protein